MSENRIIYRAFSTKYTVISQQLKNEASIIANSKTIKGIVQWDTGATNTCISQQVIDNLGLIPIGKIQILTPSGNKIVDQYMVDVLLPNRVIIKDVIVNNSEIGSQGIIALIGMDIITLGDFAVSNLNNKTYFSFRIPSKEHCDFVQDIKKEQIVGQRHGRGKKKKKQ